MLGSNIHDRLNGKRYKSLPQGRSASDVLSRDRKKEPQSLAALIEEMENDYQISFSKEVLAAHIQSVNVSIACESPDERARLLTEQLQTLWRESLPRMIDAVSFGRVAFEKENEYNADANLHFTRTLADLPFKKTELLLTEDGNFDGIKLTTRGEIFHIEPSKSWWLSLDETVLEPHGKSRYLGAPLTEWKKRRVVFELQEKMLKKYTLRGGVAHGPAQIEDENENPQDVADVLESALQHLQVGGVLFLPGERDQQGNWPIEYSETAELMDPSPLDNVLDKSDVRVLRSFGISELAVSQTADVGSFAMAVMHRLVLMSVVQGILSQFVNSFKRYVVDKHIEWNFLKDDHVSITITFPNLTDLPDSMIVEFASGVLQSPTLSPLVTSGAIDLKQILESVGVPVADDLEKRLAVAFEEAKKAAAPPPGGGNPFGMSNAPNYAPNGTENRTPRMKSLANRLIGDSLVPSREELVDEAMSELDRLYGRFIQALESQRESGQRNDMELREILETIQELEADVTTASRILGMASLWEPSIADNPAGSGVRQAKASEPGERFLAIGSVTQGSPLDQPANPSAWRFPWVDRAIQWLKEKAVVTAEEIRRIARRDRAQVFSAAGQHNLATVADLQQEVANSMVTGESLPEFRDRVESKLQETGLARYQVETIYRTNTHQAYVEAQNETLAKPFIKEQFPYVYYSATSDNRVRDHHWDLDGLIAEVDSQLHELFLAALRDFNCRCTIIPMTEDQVAGRKVSTLADASWDARKFYGMHLVPIGKGVTLAVMRAPVGGATIAGKLYKGGMFIPNEELEKASPEEKAELKRKMEAPKPDGAKPPEAEKPSVKSPSKAKVSIQGDPMKVAERLDELIPGAKIQDCASLAGAPDDADVNVKVREGDYGKEVSIEVKSRDYVAYRTIKERWNRGSREKELVLENSALEVDPSAQGQGIGTAIFARQVEHASKMGIGKITCVAAGDANDEVFNGYSTWPKLGYDGFLGNLRHSVPADLPLSPWTGPDGATKVSHLMGTPQGRDWWKQNGRTTHMEFNLKPGSYSRRTLEKYLEKKGIK